MGEIRVDPAALKSNAKQIVTVSTAVQKAGDLTWRSASDAPSYDGQFGPKVRAMGQAALTRARKHSGSTQTLSDSLNRRADAFEAADSVAVKGLSTSIDKSKRDKPGLLKFIGLIGINVLLNKAKKILGLGNLGKNTADYKIPTGFISESYEADAKYQAYVDELNNFMNTPEGRELAEAAMLAGLLFVMKDDKGNVIAQWGKTGGKPIPIEFEKLGIYSASGQYDPSQKKITINESVMKKKHTIKHTLIHEMQHAVDHRLSKSDEAYSKQTSEEEVEVFFNELKDVPIEELEEGFSIWITDEINNEVTAHDIGYDYEGGIQADRNGKKLDRFDGIYTKEEYEFILYSRPYEAKCEGDLNGYLDKIYGEDNPYKADVWVDENGKIRVDIVETGSWTSKLMEGVSKAFDIFLGLLNER